MNQNQACCVMCCGCKGILQNDGTAKTWILNESQPDARTFLDWAHADSAAAALGWDTNFAGIPHNHRCPSCRLRSDQGNEMTYQRVGAYVDPKALGAGAPIESGAERHDR